MSKFHGVRGNNNGSTVTKKFNFSNLKEDDEEIDDTEETVEETSDDEVVDDTEETVEETKVETEPEVTLADCWVLVDDTKFKNVNLPKIIELAKAAKKAGFAGIKTVKDNLEIKG